MSSPGAQLRWEMTRGHLVQWPMPAPAPSAATGKGDGGHCSVAKHGAGELAAGWDVVPSPALGRGGQGQCGNVTGATTPRKDGRSCLETAGDAAGTGSAGRGEQDGGTAGGTLGTGAVKQESAMLGAGLGSCLPRPFRCRVQVCGAALSLED